MNRNILAIILMLISIALTATFTNGKYRAVKAVQAENQKYIDANSKFDELIEARDKVLQEINSIPKEDIEDRLDKMVPDNIDNVRLIIDVTGIVAKYGVSVKNIKTSAADTSSSASKDKKTSSTPKPSPVTLTFSMTTSYTNMIDILRDIEKSLRILDISRITFNSNDINNQYDFNIELKTYWLKR